MVVKEVVPNPFDKDSNLSGLVKKGELNPGLLLMTPTEHDRFDQYERGLRKES